MPQRISSPRRHSRLVLGVIAVLAAIFLPIGLNALRDADTTKANADVQEIATALTQFFKDLRHMPACDGTDCSPITGDNNNLAFLAVGEGASALSGKYPTEATTKLSGTATFAWDFTTNAETTGAKTTRSTTWWSTIRSPAARPTRPRITRRRAAADGEGRM